MAGPTPGPWSVGRVDGSFPGFIFGPDGHVVGQASDWRRDGEDLANARLMAEAWRIPAMRAALERIERLAEGWRVGAAPGIEAAYTDAVRVIREMRDEARKARGEQP